MHLVKPPELESQSTDNRIQAEVNVFSCNINHPKPPALPLPIVKSRGVQEVC